MDFDTLKIQQQRLDTLCFGGNEGGYMEYSDVGDGVVDFESEIREWFQLGTYIVEES